MKQLPRCVVFMVLAALIFVIPVNGRTRVSRVESQRDLVSKTIKRDVARLAASGSLSASKLDSCGECIADEYEGCGLVGAEFHLGIDWIIACEEEGEINCQNSSACQEIAQ